MFVWWVQGKYRGTWLVPTIPRDTGDYQCTADGQGHNLTNMCSNITVCNVQADILRVGWGVETTHMFHLTFPPARVFHCFPFVSTHAEPLMWKCRKSFVLAVVYFHFISNHLCVVNEWLVCLTFITRLVHFVSCLNQNNNHIICMKSW